MARMIVLTGVVIGARTINSRSINGRRGILQIDRGIDADDPANMTFLLAFEWTQAAPHSFCLNDDAL